MNSEQIVNILEEAKNEAYEAAKEMAFKLEMAGRFTGCGFAWVNLYRFNDKKIDGRSRIAKELKKAGIDQNYSRSFQIWNPRGYPTQDISVLEAGADAAAKVFEKYGFSAYAGSRLD